MIATNPLVDAYVDKPRPWQAELKTLRAILRGCPLVEDFKWGKPCYTADGRNVVLLAPFKPHCALLFTQGTLMKDPEGLLVKPGENTQAALQMRFASGADITRHKAAVKAYVLEAIALAQSGAKVAFKDNATLVYPAEFQSRLDADAALRKAFEALTPGRRRQYHVHFSAPKLAATRASRVDKCVPLILAGRGMTDR